jgi:hypothetical protein
LQSFNPLSFIFFFLILSDANGRGWWDGNMEGVDYEEIGCDAEMWEGMGSIMLGGLDWN